MDNLPTTQPTNQDDTAPETLDRIGDGWSYHMEHRRDPAHVLVTLRGIAVSATVEAYYTDIVDIMNRIVGQGRSFVPIIFDTTHVEIGQLYLPVIWKSPGQVPRRVSRIIVVFSPDRGGLIGSFVRTLGGMFPGMSVVPTVDEALASLQATPR